MASSVRVFRYLTIEGFQRGNFCRNFVQYPGRILELRAREIRMPRLRLFLALLGLQIGVDESIPRFLRFSPREERNTHEDEKRVEKGGRIASSSRTSSRRTPAVQSITLLAFGIDSQIAEGSITILLDFRLVFARMPEGLTRPLPMNPLLLRVSIVIASGAVLLFAPSRLAAEGDEEKPAPATSEVVIPAIATEKNPVVVGKVTPGQVVTLKIGRVLWGGGGKEGKRPTNYRGYPNRTERNGLPWMALVAAVKHKYHVPDKKEYSFTVEENGVLVLFANDDNASGNTGKGEVTVLVLP
jgi:hypothetical protein